MWKKWHLYRVMPKKRYILYTSMSLFSASPCTSDISASPYTSVFASAYTSILFFFCITLYQCHFCITLYKSFFLCQRIRIYCFFMHHTIQVSGFCLRHPVRMASPYTCIAMYKCRFFLHHPVQVFYLPYSIQVCYFFHLTLYKSRFFLHDPVQVCRFCSAPPCTSVAFYALLYTSMSFCA